jgi:hypothetical protein
MFLLSLRFRTPWFCVSTKAFCEILSIQARTFGLSCLETFVGWHSSCLLCGCTKEKRQRSRPWLSHSTHWRSLWRMQQGPTTWTLSSRCCETLVGLVYQFVKAIANLLIIASLYSHCNVTFLKCRKTPPPVAGTGTKSSSISL